VLSPLRRVHIGALQISSHLHKTHCRVLNSDGSWLTLWHRTCDSGNISADGSCTTVDLHNISREMDCLSLFPPAMQHQNVWRSLYCCFEIKFDHKHLKSPFFTANKKNPF